MSIGEVATGRGVVRNAADRRRRRGHGGSIGVRIVSWSIVAGAAIPAENLSGDADQPPPRPSRGPVVAWTAKYCIRPLPQRAAPAAIVACKVPLSDCIRPTGRWCLG